MAFSRKEKKDRKKAVQDKFVALYVGDKEIPSYNVFIHTLEKTGERLIEIATPEVEPELHYQELDFTVQLTTKQIKIHGSYYDAMEKKKFKVYRFLVETESEYFT